MIRQGLRQTAEQTFRRVNSGQEPRFMRVYRGLRGKASQGTTNADRRRSEDSIRISAYNDFSSFPSSSNSSESHLAEVQRGRQLRDHQGKSPDHGPVTGVIPKREHPNSLASATRLAESALCRRDQQTAERAGSEGRERQETQRARESKSQRLDFVTVPGPGWRW